MAEPELADVATLLRRTGMHDVRTSSETSSVFFVDEQLGAGVQLQTLVWPHGDNTGWFWRATIRWDTGDDYLSVPLGRVYGLGDRCPGPLHVVCYYRAAVAHRMSTKRQK